MWSEWDAAQITADAVMPAATATAAFLGNYANTAGPFPNPIKNGATITGTTSYDFAANWEIDVR